MCPFLRISLAFFSKITMLQSIIWNVLQFGMHLNRYHTNQYSFYLWHFPLYRNIERISLNIQWQFSIPNKNHKHWRYVKGMVFLLWKMMCDMLEWNTKGLTNSGIEYPVKKKQVETFHFYQICKNVNLFDIYSRWTCRINFAISSKRRCHGRRWFVVIAISNVHESIE